MDSGSLALIGLAVQFFGFVVAGVVFSYKIGVFMSQIIGSIEHVGERLERNHKDALSRIGENRERLNSHSTQLRDHDRAIAKLIIFLGIIGLSTAMATVSTAGPILIGPTGAEFSVRASNPEPFPVVICWDRAETGEELGCTAIGGGGVASALLSVPFTPGADAEIRARACHPPGTPGVHPQAECSGYSADHYPIAMGPLSVPVLLGPAP